MCKIGLSDIFAPITVFYNIVQWYRKIRDVNGNINA